jgi:hypothetical protein
MELRTIYKLKIITTFPPAVNKNCTVFTCILVKMARTHSPMTPITLWCSFKHFDRDITAEQSKAVHVGAQEIGDNGAAGEKRESR